jgi:hypothetical protein
MPREVFWHLKLSQVFFRMIVYLTSINSVYAILYMTLYGYRLNISLCVSANSWLEEIENV